MFFRRDIHAGHELLDEVKQAVLAINRIVAVVVNAIDEQLKAACRLRSTTAERRSLPLEALLSAADGAERAVLLVADHGHVAGDAMRVVPGRPAPGRNGGARWRALSDGEQPHADEVIPSKDVVKAHVARRYRGALGYVGRQPCAALRRTRWTVIGRGRRPAFLIAPEWLDRVAGEDVELSCRVLPEPDWWALKVVRPAASPSPCSPRRPRSNSSSSLSRQRNRRRQHRKRLVSRPWWRRLRSSKLFLQQVVGIPKPD